MKKFIVFLALLTFCLSINADEANKVAQTGVKMLDVGMGARACGMGEAFTVLGQDASALFYNPAGVGEIEGNFDLYAGQTQWIADISYINVAGVYNAGVWGKFGFSLITPDYGEFYATRVDAAAEEGFVEIEGGIDVSAFCAGIAYAREFTDKFTVGLQAKWVTQHLGESFFTAVTEEEDTVEVGRDNNLATPCFDFGLLFYPGFKSFAFGMSVRNFSPAVTYERIAFELPLTFALGVGMNILDLFGDYPDYSCNIAADMIHPRDWDEQYHVGAELSYKDMIFLRGGYKFNYFAEGLNAGVGINVGGVKIDYSYSEFDLPGVDMINRLSAGFAF
ncbi:MAG: PorV/PorQ family protein [candidate division WOR-3 bacterium]